MKIRVAVGQIKPRKGDYTYNLARIGELIEQVEQGAPATDVLVLPETALSGYFLEGGVREAARSREELFADLLSTYRGRTQSKDSVLDLCVGFYEIGDGKYYNSAMYCTLTGPDPPAGVAPAVHHVHRKFFLPTYGVFDEKRFVSRGRIVGAFNSRFGRAAILICEDAWHSITGTLAALKGAQVIYIVSASPGREFGGPHIGNVARWNVLLPGIADEHNIWVVYSGLVGFEGGKGFTGSSTIVDPWGNTLVQASPIDECIVTGTIDLGDVAAARAASPLLADLEAALGDVMMELDQVAREPYAI